MELRSGRLLRSSCGGGRDRISALPDDLLLLILARLRCIATAARTSVLSRRWSGGLWTRLREIVFRDVAFPSVEAALGRVDSPAVSLVDIRFPRQCMQFHVPYQRMPNHVPHQCTPNHIPDSAGVQSLLRAAARHEPEKIVFHLWYSNCPSIEVDLSCFHRATSIELFSPLLFPRLPASVEKLSLSGSVSDLDPLLSCCPRLRTLCLSSVVQDSGHLSVRSASLQELVVDRTRQLTRRVSIVAPVLKQLSMSFLSRGIGVSVSAPMVEEMYWHCWYFDDYDIAFGLWRIQHVTLQTAQRQGELPSLEICANAVRLSSCSIYCIPGTKLIKCCQIVLPELACFTCPRELLCTGDREAYDCQVFCFGATSRNKWTCFRRARGSSPWMVRIRGCTQRLMVTLRRSTVKEVCPFDCLRQTSNWRSRTISLSALEEVEINGFEGYDHEIDFLKLIFKCAPMLKRMTVKMSQEASISKDGCAEIYNIFEAYSSVECNVDHNSG